MILNFLIHFSLFTPFCRTRATVGMCWKARNGKLLPACNISSAALDNSKVRKVASSGRPLNAAFGQKQLGLRLHEAEVEVAGTELETRILISPKNQVTPNMKVTLFMPRFG